MTLLLCITVRQIGTSMVIQNTLTGNDKLVPVFNSPHFVYICWNDVSDFVLSYPILKERMKHNIEYSVMKKLNY